MLGIFSVIHSNVKYDNMNKFLHIVFYLTHWLIIYTNRVFNPFEFSRLTINQSRWPSIIGWSIKYVEKIIREEYIYIGRLNGFPSSCRHLLLLFFSIRFHRFYISRFTWIFKVRQLQFSHVMAISYEWNLQKHTHKYTYIHVYTNVRKWTYNGHTYASWWR